jgi:hypothetical protein
MKYPGSPMYWDNAISSDSTALRRDGVKETLPADARTSFRTWLTRSGSRDGRSDAACSLSTMPG